MAFVSGATPMLYEEDLELDRQAEAIGRARRQAAQQAAQGPAASYGRRGGMAFAPTEMDRAFIDAVDRARAMKRDADLKRRMAKEDYEDELDRLARHRARQNALEATKGGMGLGQDFVAQGVAGAEEGSGVGEFFTSAYGGRSWFPQKAKPKEGDNGSSLY